MIAKAIPAEPGNVSEIQSLTERVQRLSTAVDDANKWLLWSLVGAAIAAVLVGLATYVVISRSKRLADTQDLLSKAKDRQLASDLGSKEVEIGKAKDDAAKAGRDAAEANKSTELLRQENLATSQTLVAEQNRRLELEKALAPRTLWYNQRMARKTLPPCARFQECRSLWNTCQTLKPLELWVP